MDNDFLDFGFYVYTPRWRRQFSINSLRFRQRKIRFAALVPLRFNEYAATPVIFKSEYIDERNGDIYTGNAIGGYFVEFDFTTFEAIYSLRVTVTLNKVN